MQNFRNFLLNRKDVGIVSMAIVTNMWSIWPLNRPILMNIMKMLHSGIVWQRFSYVGSDTIRREFALLEGNVKFTWEWYSSQLVAGEIDSRTIHLDFPFQKWAKTFSFEVVKL